MATDIRFIDDGGGQLVLEGGDQLILRGGTIEIKGRLRLTIVEDGTSEGPPSQGQLGDIVIVLKRGQNIAGPITESSIWVCLPAEIQSVSGPTYWRPIQLGPAVGVL